MLNQKQVEMIGGSLTPKFLATQDGSGNVNLVMINSIEYYMDMIVFSNLFMWKTARNLEKNPAVSVIVMTDKLEYFTVDGNFVGFEESGELVEHLNKSEFTRYNAYTGIRGAGKIEINTVSPVKKMPLPWFLYKFLKSRIRLPGKAPAFPANVADKFTTLMSIKIITYLDDVGKQIITPLPALKADGEHLISPVKLPAGKKYAANVITPDIVSFQIKGTAEQYRLKVEEVYAAGPPVAGKLIWNGKMAYNH